MPVLDKILESRLGFIILYHTCEHDEADEKERLRKQILHQQQVVSPRVLYSWESAPLFSAAKRVVVKTAYDHTKQRSLSVTLKRNPAPSAGLQLTTSLLGPIVSVVPLEAAETKCPVASATSVVSEASRFIGSHFRTKPLIEQLAVATVATVATAISDTKDQVVPRVSLKLTDDSKQQWTIDFSYIEQPRSAMPAIPSMPGIRLSLPTGTIIDHY